MDNNNQSPTFLTLAQRIGRTGLGLLQNRGELFFLELQEEKGRALGLLIGAMGLLFATMMAVLLITATIIFLIPEETRVYAAGGFAVFYLLGATWAFFSIKSQLKRTPFGQTLSELKKDRTWLESLE